MAVREPRRSLFPQMDSPRPAGLWAVAAVRDVTGLHRTGLLTKSVRRQLSEPPATWIDSATRTARSGGLQVGVTVLVLVWAVVTLPRRTDPPASFRRPVAASRIRSRYELCSQAGRAAACALLVAASLESPRLWPNVAPVACATALGLLRLAAGVRRRHTLLHQINTLLAASFALLLAAELLPCIEIGSRDRPSNTVRAALLSLGAALLVALATPREWIPPPCHPELVERAPDPVPSPEETCSWFNYFFTFDWLTPTIWKGTFRPVQLADLPQLPWYDEPLLLFSKLRAARKASSRTLTTLLRFQRRELTTMACWVGLSFALELVAPYGMYQLLEYISDPDRAVFHPAVWLFLIFVGPMSRSVTFAQYIFTGTRLIVRVKSAVTQELYHRAMTSMELEDDVINAIVAKGSAKGPDRSTSAGRLANLMASDLEAVIRARDIVMVGIGVPVGVFVAFVGLYLIVGWSSLVGIAFMLCMVPVPAWVARKMGATQRKVKIAQDSRISLVSEYLGSIKTIKYFAWEEPMIGRVQEARAREQRELWRMALLWSLMGEITELIPVLTLLVIFGLYVGAMKQPLTASVAFTALTLLTTMRRNINMLGMISRNITIAFISLDRLDRFFSNTTPLTRFPRGPLRVKNAFFRRNRKAHFRLRDISIDFVEGGLNAVMGQSGSGKTTLLLSMLGETILERGTVQRPDDVAFASQTAWLQSETIRENILFHSPFEEARYDRVVKACCLDQDFDELPRGDSTEVGENGTTLSGGQRSRVALARALYSKAPVLLLDDIFSALDTKTAAAVWELCFCGDLLKGRTTVLVTQMPWVGAQADLVATLENGAVRDISRNLGVIRRPVTLHPDERRIEYQPAQAADDSVASPSEPPASASADDKQDVIASEMKASGATARLMFFKYMLYFGGPAYAVFALSVTVLANAALIGTSFWLSVWVDAYSKEEAVNIAFYLGIYAAVALGSAVLQGVSFLTYARGGWLAARRLHRSLIHAVMYVPLTWWKDVPVGRVINRFSGDIDALDGQLSRMLQTFLEELVRLFFRIGAVSSILPIFMLPGVFACFVGVVCGEMYTRTTVMVKRLVSSSQSPVFSQFGDTLGGLAVIRARSQMPRIFEDKLAEKLRAYSRAAEANYNCNRWISLRVDFVTALVTFSAGLIAVSRTSVIEAGLVGFSLSNATSLSQTILGLVRSMNDLEVELQSFHRVREYTKIEPEDKADSARREEATMALDASARRGWPETGTVEFQDVTIRYDVDGPDILRNINLKFAANERVAVVGRTGSGKSTLVLSLLRFTNIVSGQILYDGVDITLIPPRRLRQAITIIPQEAVLFNGTVGSNLDPSGEVPARSLEAALQMCSNIASFQFHVSENHRAEEPAAGTGESTPLLGSGSGGGARLGYETTGTTAVNRSRSSPAKGAVRKASGVSLSTVVLPKGENFSHGQRQVLSLCRALVRKSKLMLLDEATASMDYDTDRGIQAVLRRELEESSLTSGSAAGGGNGGRGSRSNRTLVTIAHRLRTIFDYDKVVVMGGGRVLEVGSPGKLYAAGGQFYDMVTHSGEEGELLRLMAQTTE